jgi:hypothetical protein
MMEGEWDRPRDLARALRERDGNDNPLAEGVADDNDKYNEDGDIPNNDGEYAVGLTVLMSPLTSPST